jgi:4'-phosphopantetheinyl transferase
MRLLDSLPDPREVHVWFLELGASDPLVEECFRTLSADERERASRFRFEHLRSEFSLSRGMLRLLLGRYLAVEPARLQFAYGARGKPQLASPESPLRFNLAHSGMLAAYAFAVGCEVGIDVERMRPLDDAEDLVRRFFSPAERDEWLDLDPSRRNEAFYHCWTSKEAYIKASGDGLSTPLDSFRVSLRPDEPAALLRVAGDPAAAGKWSLWSLRPADGYVGSLALPQRGRSVCTVGPLTPAALLALLSSSSSFPLQTGQSPGPPSLK